MKITIIQFPFGVVAFDKDKNVVEKVLFSKKTNLAAKSILKIESGNISDVKPLVLRLQNLGYDVFAFDTTNLANEAERKLSLSVEVPEASEIEAFRNLGMLGLVVLIADLVVGGDPRQGGVGQLLHVAAGAGGPEYAGHGQHGLLRRPLPGQRGDGRSR